MINKIQEPFERGAGTLLPVASLPSNYGIGTFGKAAYDFVDFLHKSGQKYWQVLPIGPTGYGDSPYQSFSAFAGNPYFIDFDLLIEENLLDISEIEKINWGDNPNLIDYGKIYENRYSVLRVAFKNFNTSANSNYSDLSPKLKNQFRINAAKVAVPIPPKLILPACKAKSPVPKIMVTAATIRFLFCEKSTLFSIQILAPAIVIKPKTIIEAPVRIAVGIV